MFLTRYRRTLFLTVTGIVLVVSVFSLLTLRLFTQKRSVRNELESLKHEIRSANSSIEILGSSVSSLIENTNEIREVMSLPEKQYPLTVGEPAEELPSSREEPAADDEPERIKGFYAVLTCIKEELQTEKRETSFVQFRESQDLAILLETFNLSQKESGPVSSILLHDGIPIFSLGVNDDGFYTLHSFTGGSLSFTVPDQKVYDFIKQKIDQNSSGKSAGKEDPWTEKIKSRVNSILADEGFSHSLRETGLFIDEEPRQDEEYVYFDFRDKSNNIAGSLGFQRITGRAYVFDKEGVPIKNIGSANMESIHEISQKKKEWPDKNVI